MKRLLEVILAAVALTVLALGFAAVLDSARAAPPPPLNVPKVVDAGATSYDASMGMKVPQVITSATWAAQAAPSPRPTDPAEPRLDLSTNADPSDTVVVAILHAMLDAAKSRNWRMLVGMILSVLVFLLRWRGAKRIPWLATDRGGVALLVGTGLGTMAVTLLLSKTTLTFDHVSDAVINTFFAGGLYTALKKAILPSDKKVEKPVVIAAGPAGDPPA